MARRTLIAPSPQSISAAALAWRSAKRGAFSVDNGVALAGYVGRLPFPARG